MANFSGGSAYTMARDIGEGYVTVTERTFKTFTGADVTKLSHEIERYLRELRGTQMVSDPLPEVQARNRKIQRLNSARMVVRMARQRLRL